MVCDITALQIESNHLNNCSQACNKTKFVVHNYGNL